MAADKTMSHLELLMQKGDIQGPPYSMPEGLVPTCTQVVLAGKTISIVSVIMRESHWSRADLKVGV